MTILISNTLGTALGDFAADDAGLGFEKGSLVFAGLIALVALAHFFTKAPKPILFWAAYVLTRPPRRDPWRHTDEGACARRP